MNVPIWIIVGFQQRDRQDLQKLNSYTLYGPPVTSAKCTIGTEKISDSGIFLNYDDDNYMQVYDQSKEAFRALAKDDTLQPYMSDHDFRSSNNRNDIG